MAIPVMMPKQGQTVESCIIYQWFKKKGDSVKVGEPLFSYETDKASFEEEAKVDGILLEIFYGEGDEVPVLFNVAVIGKLGESVDEFRPGGSPPPTAESPAPIDMAQETSVVVPVIVPSTTPTVATDTKIRVSPRARAIAEKKGINLASVKGTGPNGRIIVRDINQNSPTPALPKGEGVSSSEVEEEGVTMMVSATTGTAVVA